MIRNYKRKPFDLLHEYYNMHVSVFMEDLFMTIHLCRPFVYFGIFGISTSRTRNYILPFDVCVCVCVVFNNSRIKIEIMLFQID